MRADRVSALFAVVAVAVSLGSTVAAQDAPAPPGQDPQEAAPNAGTLDEDADYRARQHFQAASSYYASGDYEDALREFQRSHALSGRPELYFNFSLCLQQLGRLAEAAEFLARFLDEVAEVEDRATLERRLQRLRERAAETADGRASEGVEPEGVEPEAAETRETSVPAVVSFAVGGAGLVSAVIAGSLALAERSSLEDRGCGTTTDCGGDAARALRTRAIVTDVAMGLTAVGVALGIVFWLTNSRDDDTSRAVRLTPWAHRRAAGASVEGRF